MGSADPTGIANVLKNVLAEPTTGNLIGRIERELTIRGLDADDGAGREPERCGRCGGLRDGRDHESHADRVCRCGGRAERLLSYLDSADPSRRMVLEAIDASEPTLDRALEATRGIVSGERRRGMLLMGPPGRGKTFLMVGLGRALLGRGRDAGYYNAARLISRIQDTYGENGGETRRAGEDPRLSFRHPLAEGEPRHRFRTLIVGIMNRLAQVQGDEGEGSGHAGAVGWEKYEESTDGGIAALDEAVFELARLVAALSAVDGAVVMSKHLEVLGFGAEISGASPPVRTVERALDPEGGRTERETTDGVGTRHRSAYRLCGALPGAVAVVVSQDGGARFVTRKDGAVTYWDYA